MQFLENQNQVKVSIVGDSCLFVLSGHELKETHPLKKSSDFNDRLEYFASYANHKEYSPNFFPIRLNYEESPESLHFILATDALSEYIFKCLENKEAIFKDLLSIDSPEKVENFVAERRNSSSIKMKNDDVALMILSVSNATILEYPSQLTDTTKRDSEVPISELDKTVYRNKRKNPNERTDDSSRKRPTRNKSKNRNKQINNLGNQRAILGALATVFLLFIFVDKTIGYFNSEKDKLPRNSNAPAETTAPIKTFKTTELKQKTVIYKDPELKNILIDSSFNLLEVIIMEENDKWIKFETPL